MASLSPEEVLGLHPPLPDGGPGEPVELRDGDWRTMRALAGDGRTGFSRLAGITGWSEASVRRRPARLRSRDALRFSVEISPALFGYGVEAVVRLKVAPSRLPGASDALAGHREVAFAAHVTGSSNLVAMVMCRDIGELSRYVSERPRRRSSTAGPSAPGPCRPAGPLPGPPPGRRKSDAGARDAGVGFSPDIRT
ncbi:Lrp/AsnC family transcriptional regulator [Streptomyces sp. AV19]|uniref:Lrp/AsnC family transcriptional regulator n=1 Tax=Streptomyces sp. AV19 TaxID=2793068 RepID=UPI001F2D5795|nr:Lrp/AsnC family transcriptional regulator [Streptomyces sp. AV19]MDG4534698.1 Lrp/AsnC family transcriptional regulator [Streptomyces sp. AV19]